MNLYDVTHSARWIDPQKVERFDGIQKCSETLHPATWEKVLRTVDDAVEWATQNGGKIVWCRAASLFGEGSPLPYKDVEHLWSSLERAVGNDVALLKTLGALLRWRISLRPEEYWLALTTETDNWDYISQKYVSYTQYFISTNFTPPGETPPPSGWGQKLASALGARIS